MSMLFQVVMPVFLIFLVGYIGQKALRLHIKSVSTTALYLMTPALIFRTFYKNRLDSTYLYIVIYGILLSVILILLVKGLSRIRKYNASITNGLILATAFMNNGNLGAPIILFAFGDNGFQYAVAIMIFHTIVMSTLGLYFAAKGKLEVREALLSVVKMPIVHAGIAALVWQYLNLPMPENILAAINIVAEAAIPSIMLVLGMQLAEIKIVNFDWGKISLALVFRLLLSPLIAWGITLLLPVEPLLGKVMIVEAAMPTAAITTLYALQYDTEPNLVSSITFISTLLSIITLSMLLNVII
ncbi:AEC family transporter [Calderihabitans maritimus]|uniref:Transport protein n=1 Tax=Calderihabitans maritimus TaxID=1246530 RepID=A0A1Z5HSU4_9FIRM|nr:AEC family transporter [Calderihabitans maritimus]GAW92508.1 transport protein [Calderihabitans maritimus]